MKTKIKYFLFGVIFCLICTWIGSLIKCEILTYKHYDEFKDAYKQNTMFGEIEYFKVLEYAPNRTHNLAQVYYVSEGNAAGDVLTFEYNSDTDLWEQIGWSTIWSDMGSASDVIYPYWWHFIYGGF